MTEIERMVTDLRATRGLRALIALSGTADSNKEAEQATQDVIDVLSGRPVGIITSGTRTGVPGRTIRYAIQMGLPVVRVYPEYARARGHLQEVGADLEISVPPRTGSSVWGDESELFVKLADGIIFIGGGSGTLLEIAFWAKYSKTLVGRKSPPIPAVPLALGEGWSDWLCRQGLQRFDPFVSLAVPERPIASGREAGEWMLERLGLTSGGQK